MSFITKVKKDINKKIIWTAYCIKCNETLEECANGSMIEAAAIHHTLETGHDTFVAFTVGRWIKGEIKKQNKLQN